MTAIDVGAATNPPLADAAPFENESGSTCTPSVVVAGVSVVDGTACPLRRLILCSRASSASARRFFSASRRLCADRV